MNYNEVNSLLSGRNRQHKKYANNTYFTRHDDHLALVYHSTEIVKFYPNGDIVLDNGGWYTSTTKERINWELPEGYQLTQDKGVWYLASETTERNPQTYSDCYSTIWPTTRTVYHKFANGITIKANGEVEGYAQDNLKADKKLKAKVKAYSQLCADAIPLNKPSSGDCWHCHLVTQDGTSLGDAIKDTSHLDSHIKESYIVPSLVFHALKQSGNTDFILSLVFNNPDNAMLDIARDRVKRSVYRYILRRKGYAV